MKRLIKIITIIYIVFSVNILSVMAAPVSSITGPSVVRAGDTITVTVNIGGNGLKAIRGKIKYDNDYLTYKSSSVVIKGWTMDIIPSSGVIDFLGIDDTLTSPINSSLQIFKLTFTVKSNVNVGTNIKIRAEEMSASDGNSDLSIADSVYSVTISPPLSGNSFLSKLNVKNASITPAFNKNTTVYNASVPFDISKLDIEAVPEDSKAKVAVSNNNLAAGTTTAVKITVTAENGSKKVYTINVSRGADPNYKPGRNANLSEITVDGFLLSPPFDKNTTSYVVWLPYEVTKVTVKGKPEDNKAIVEIIGGNELVEGDNTIKIVCTAENGTTKKEYEIIAKRANRDISSSPGIVPSPTPGESISPTSSRAPSISANTEKDKSDGYVTVFVGVLCLGAGFGCGYLICNYFAWKRIKAKYYDEFYD